MNYYSAIIIFFNSFNQEEPYVGVSITEVYSCSQASQHKLLHSQPYTKVIFK